MKINKRICEICGKEIIGIGCSIIVPLEHVEHWILPKATNIVVCYECEMCYLAQHMEMTNKEITDWFKWMEKEV